MRWLQKHETAVRWVWFLAMSTLGLLAAAVVFDALLTYCATHVP